MLRYPSTHFIGRGIVHAVYDSVGIFVGHQLIVLSWLLGLGSDGIYAITVAFIGTVVRSKVLCHICVHIPNTQRALYVHTVSLIVGGLRIFAIAIVGSVIGQVFALQPGTVNSFCFGWSFCTELVNHPQLHSALIHDVIVVLGGSLGLGRDTLGHLSTWTQFLFRLGCVVGSAIDLVIVGESISILGLDLFFGTIKITGSDTEYDVAVAVHDIKPWLFEAHIKLTWVLAVFLDVLVVSTIVVCGIKCVNDSKRTVFISHVVDFVFFLASGGYFFL